MYWGPISPLFLSTLLLCFYSTFAQYLVKVKVENMTTVQCPSVKTRKNIVSDLKASLTPLYTVGSKSHTLEIEDPEGKNGTLTFPGCYHFKIHMKVKKPIRNPYAEVSIRMGTKIPCRRADGVRETFVEENCRNKSAPASEWCPKSRDGTVRSISTHDSCRFCNLCHHADNVGKGKDKDTRKFLKSLGGELGDGCAFENPDEVNTLNFQICTPSEDEFAEFNEKTDGDIENYWKYLQHGSMHLVVHLLERKPTRPSDVTTCDNLCDHFGTTLTKKYKANLAHHVRNFCVPKDKYVTCFHTAIKFSIESNFKKK